jgi:50S ribosomal protein L16 3-hydroxylase
LPKRKPLLKLDPAAFMRRHWQRRPLLVRGAFEPFEDPLSALKSSRSPATTARARAWCAAAARAGRWSTARFPPRASSNFHAGDWTVLVQDTNHFSARAQRLLAAFDFIPHARVDDLMVSYAVPGGGSGRMWIRTTSSSSRGAAAAGGASRGKRKPRSSRAST